MTALAERDLPVDSSPVLEVDGLSVEVRTISGTLRAVNEVSFGARRGETLALLGESGCGKSMTATALVGLLEPVADIVGGRARLAHQGGTVDLLTADRKKRRAMAGTELAIVFQDAQWFHGAENEPAWASIPSETTAIWFHLKISGIWLR